MKNFLILLVALGCFAANAECREATYVPDLVTPVDNLKILIEAALDFNLPLLLQALIQLLTSCVAIPTPATAALLASLDIKTFSGIIQQDPTVNLTEKIILYMKSPEFADIHYHLWNDTEWNDVIALFYNSGWKDDKSVYNNFKLLYQHFDCPLIIPDQPPAVLSTKQFMPKSVRRNISETNIAPILPNACDLATILEILAKFLESHFLEVANLFRFVLEEISNDPSIHLLHATISEPVKGVSFRNTRSRTSVIKLIKHWDDGLKNNEFFKLIIGILSELSGINFSELDINVVGNIISFVEYLIWRTPFPLVPIPTLAPI